MFSLALNDLALGRRQAVASLMGLGAGLGVGLGVGLGFGAARAAVPPSRVLDFNDPVDNLYAFGKIWSSYDAPAVGAFHGLMYLRLGDQRMMPIFGYVGTGVVHAKFDRASGTLIRKSRETGYFTDLRTGEILETWTNPLTNETVPVYHFYNDLAAFKMTAPNMPIYALGKSGDKPTLMNEGTVFPEADGTVPLRLPFEQAGDDHMMLSWDYTHEYTNPVTPEGWPTYSTGPRISPSEHFTINFSRRDLENPDLPAVRHTSGFARLSQPWPFMKMGGPQFKDAVVFGRMFSHKGLKGFDEVPRKVLDYVEKHAPRYLELPPGWDTIRSDRLDTWMAFAQDVPPENKNYPWQKRDLSPEVAPPTGLGAVIYRS
ncbi:MAG: DUF1838 family protein [Rhodospirillaceae bacterium]|nr:DUF1838 family protein [Rhodospirillaceae bacterium]